MVKLSPRILRSSLLILALIFSATIIYFRHSLVQFSQLGIIGIFVISFLGSATVLLPVPSLLATFATGNIYHPFIVGFVAATGAALGEFTGFLAGIGSRALIGKNKLIFTKYKNYIAKYGSLAIFVMAVLPNPFFDIVGITAGIMGVKSIKFFLAVLAGQIVKFTVTAFLGAQSIDLFQSIWPG